jgi:hypothetical protein
MSADKDRRALALLLLANQMELEAHNRGKQPMDEPMRLDRQTRTALEANFGVDVSEFLKLSRRELRDARNRVAHGGAVPIFISLHGEPADRTAMTVASARFNRWMAFLPARVVPPSVQNGVVGDGLERISRVVAAGGSKWAVRAVYLSVAVAIALEIVRHVARAFKGEKARK